MFRLSLEEFLTGYNTLGNVSLFQLCHLRMTGKIRCRCTVLEKNNVSGVEAGILQSSQGGWNPGPNA